MKGPLTVKVVTLLDEALTSFPQLLVRATWTLKNQVTLEELHT